MFVRRHADLTFVDLPGRQSADPFVGEELDVSTRVVTIAPGVARSPHRHPHSSEVVYVVQGTGRAWQDGATVDLGPGDLVHVPPGVAHATLAVDGPLVLVCFFPHPRLHENIEELPHIVLPPPR